VVKFTGSVKRGRVQGMQMAVDFSFGQVEAVLVQLNAIASEKRPAFTARLKHLLKQGVPRGARSGRGKASAYNFGQLMQMVVAVELVQSGAPPALAAQIVLGNWTEMRMTIWLSTHNQVELASFAPPVKESHWYWVLTPEVLRDLSEAGMGKFDHFEAIETVPHSQIAEHVARQEQIGVMGLARRKLILDATSITRAAVLIIAYQMCVATPEELRADIFDEMQRDQSVLDEAAAEISHHGALSTKTTAELSGLISHILDVGRTDADAIDFAKALTLRQKGIIVDAWSGMEVPMDPSHYEMLVNKGLIQSRNGELSFTEFGGMIARLLQAQDELKEDADGNRN
jgi:hypothetical protein